jgi:hypothetical protein
VLLYGAKRERKREKQGMVKLSGTLEYRIRAAAAHANDFDDTRR